MYTEVFLWICALIGFINACIAHYSNYKARQAKLEKYGEVPEECFREKFQKFAMFVSGLTFILASINLYKAYYSTTTSSSSSHDSVSDE